MKLRRIREARPLRSPDALDLTFLNACDKCKKLLILDIDQTLLYSEAPSNRSVSGNPRREPDFQVEVGRPPVLQKVWLRPGLTCFLQEVGELYDVIVFSVGSSSYVRAMVQRIDPGQKYIKEYFSRQHVTEYLHPVSPDKGVIYVKDFTPIVEGKGLENVVIVDDGFYSTALHKQNTIRIKEFKGQASDFELDMLAGLLRDIARVPNITVCLQSRLQKARRRAERARR